MTYRRGNEFYRCSMFINFVFELVFFIPPSVIAIYYFEAFRELEISEQNNPISQCFYYSTQDGALISPMCHYFEYFLLVFFKFIIFEKELNVIQKFRLRDDVDGKNPANPSQAPVNFKMYPLYLSKVPAEQTCARCIDRCGSVANQFYRHRFNISIIF